MDQGSMNPAYIGIDVGAETIKVVKLEEHGARVLVADHTEAAHHKDPQGTILALLAALEVSGSHGMAATGRLSRVLRTESVPTKAAIRRGVRLVHSELAAVTVISIGGHGFSVFEIGAKGEEWYQQNSRCSQGTGNFLAQLVQRFGLSVEEASLLCDAVETPAPLSGRCPVILKTDMTHLANKGEDKARILAGLYDAVCENVLTLVRARLAPRDVVLIGGVSRSSRVRRCIGRWLAERGMRLVERKPEDGYLEAIGAAMHAMEHPHEVGALESLVVTSKGTALELVPPLREALGRVRLMKPSALHVADGGGEVLLGLDIGSTGSKAVGIDASTGAAVFEHYLSTEGAPVSAAQKLIEAWSRSDVAHRGRLLGLGITGSGREVVGSLLRTCYGDSRVFIMNEIAAHARGATSIDPQVDTIFEIGGQDAKYIRLEQGRVIDAAMNEACSAGTGSFIAEQGTRFDGIGEDVRKLGRLALEADQGVSLGQHCSVFMAEVIDEAVTQGIARDVIIAGLFDSVIQNYLNRVKGTRSVGNRVFCQGMPFSSPALAAAVARQTGREVVVPPNPGTIGALGIALLAREELRRTQQSEPIDCQVFLNAQVVAKETFHCKSTQGCGGSGNKCRIDRLKTVVNGVTERFLWGGNCSLYDRGAGRAKLPDLSPDPFRERDGWLDVMVQKAAPIAGAPTVAMTDEFALKGLAPLMHTFLRALGFNVRLSRRAGGSTLRRGIEGARIPYCAPMQIAHGALFELADTKPDYLLIPMLQELPRVRSEPYAVLCPIVQALPDLVGGLLPDGGSKILRPTVRFDRAGYDGPAFRASMRTLAVELGAGGRFESAFREAVAMQRQFEQMCISLGRSALQFCRKENVVPVAVLGRPYTIYNDVLNSNVPSILRSLGVLPIPVDCLPVDDEAPIYDQYWAYTQRNLRAADFVRRTPGLYSVFCSNYACGPDSFTLHFFSYVMRGKPFAVVETDGHSGDAGTKTRMEAFLYCVDSELRSKQDTAAARTDLRAIEQDRLSPAEARRKGSVLLVPRMGPQAEVAAASLRAEGLKAEVLPLSTREDVRTGRRHTSGKECVPMILTLGTLLNRVQRDRDNDQTFGVLMPTARGPCRFGVYNVLHKISLQQAGWGERVRMFSPDDGDYFREFSPEFSLRTWIGFAAHDMLEAMLLDVRPVERRPGAANAIYQHAFEQLVLCIEQPASSRGSSALRELFGSMWGTRQLLQRAAREMAAIKNKVRDVPTVALVGEIYVRLDPFANDFVIEKLEARGIRVRFAPFIEWLEYTSHLAEKRVLDRAMRDDDNPLSIGVTGLVQRTTLGIMHQICAEALGWGRRSTVRQALQASRPYISPELTGEAALTVGGPVHEFREGQIQGVVVVGPHECMPCKISEAQLGKVVEDMNLPCLVLALNGDPLDTEALDRFAYDLHEGHRRGLGRSLGVIAPSLWRIERSTPLHAHESGLVPEQALTARRKPARSSLVN
jgi:activator of 2-hydroxyglutaryl-CoA dehydratase/predicted nucleotide-binding protein (sugar kinase/HSP70/actin superfamily)